MKSSTLFTVLLLALVLAFILQTRAQDDTWNIVTLPGDTLSACVLDSLDDYVLSVQCGGDELLIPVDSITLVFRNGRSAFLRGGIIGAVAGVAIGCVTTAICYKPPEDLGGVPLGFTYAAVLTGGAVLGGLGGFLTGGTIGTATGHPSSYDLQGATVDMKLGALSLLTHCTKSHR